MVSDKYYAGVIRDVKKNVFSLVFFFVFFTFFFVFAVDKIKKNLFLKQDNQRQIARLT